MAMRINSKTIVTENGDRFESYYRLSNPLEYDGVLYLIDKVYVKRLYFGLLREVRINVYKEFASTFGGDRDRIHNRWEAVTEALGDRKHFGKAKL